MLEWLAQGETDAQVLAGLAQPEWRATPPELTDALAAAATMDREHREILELFLERLELLERQIAKLNESMARCLHAYRDAVVRLAAVPGFGMDSPPA